MSIRRRQNWLNQQRVDVPHLRSVESAISNDFDELLKSLVTGEGQSYVLRGFTIDMSAAIGNSASSLQMVVSDAALLHQNSNESGTFFQIPSGTANETLSSTTNTRVSGSFTASSLNYVGIEFNRNPDNSTISQVFFFNPTNKTEFSKNVPLAITMDYSIVITASLWASNVLPIAIVETDPSNNVISIEDRRPMLFRLGRAGSTTPDPFFKYGWTEGREENFWKSTDTTSPFTGGDKQIGNLKDFADALMTEILEIKGTKYWSSKAKAGSITKLRGDTQHLQMTGSGAFTHAISTAGQMNWSSDIDIKFVGSRLHYKILANPTGGNITLADDQVAYFNIVRGVDIAPTLNFTSGSPIVTSVGGVSWTSGLQPGDFIKIKGESDDRYFEIFSVDTASQVTLTENYDTTASNVSAQYAYGTYQAVATPSTNRDLIVDFRKNVPFDQDVYWLFLRADNGTTPARIYIKGSSGGELEQGESREISDNTTREVLTYIGSPSEVDSTPDYTNAIVASVSESRDITFPAGSAFSSVSAEYFTINSALDLAKFYVYPIVDGIDNDPAPGGLTRVAVAINSGDTALQVATKFANALDSLGEFNVAVPSTPTITVINSQVGTDTPAANVSMPVGFVINTTIAGTGSFNFVLADGENLTKSIKRLDEEAQSLNAAINNKPYEEKISVVSSVTNPDIEILPSPAGTNIKLPKNTHNSNIQETYVIGAADLVVFLNGNRLNINDDYNEISTTEISLTFAVSVGDILTFTKAEVVGAAGGAGSGSTGVNLGPIRDADVFKQNVGSQLQFRRLTAGTGVTISQGTDDIVITSAPTVAPSNIQFVNGVNYLVTNTDDVILASNAGVDITITLPDAASVTGKQYTIKKLDAGNTMFIKSVLSQTLDGIDIDASPTAVTIQNESLTIISSGANWFII